MTQSLKFLKNGKTAVFIALSFLLLRGLARGQDFSFSIDGEIQNPGTFSLPDPEKFPTIPVRVREYSPNGNYRGLCAYWGVPLQLVLQRVTIQKSDTALFKHELDMAIILKNPSGKKVTLSWGEIFYQSNPTHYLLAFRKSVIKPTVHPAVKPGSCQMCHNGKTIRKGKVLPRIPSDSLSRVAFLIIRDGKIVSSLKQLSSIEIKSVNRFLPRLNDRNHVFSSHVTIVNGKKKGNLADYLKRHKFKKIAYTLPEIGSGCGYHGRFAFQGYRLEDIFSQEISTPDFWGLLISAPDGYRTFVSRNEIVGGSGRKALLAVSKNGRPLKEPEGKFMLILPNDLFFDRWIRAVNLIEILSRSE